MTAADRPIFIVGPGRSGTTLLQSRLSAHPGLVILPETHFMAWAEPWGLGKRPAPRDFDAFWRRYTSSRWFEQLDMDPRALRSEIRATGDTFPGVLAALLETGARQAGKRRVGEKTPGHSRFLGLLLDWFPDCRVLVTQRDPRAVIASQLRTPYIRNRITPPSLGAGAIVRSRPEQVLWHIDNWLEVYGPRLAPHQGDPRLHRVVYEELVHDPEPVLRQVCSFLNEPFEPAMLQPEPPVAASSLPPAPAASDMKWWEQQHHQRSRGPVSAASLDRWRQDLSLAEIAMIEGRCGRVMQEMGYSLSTTAAQQRRGRVAARSLGSAVSAEGAARAAARRVLSAAHDAAPAARTLRIRARGLLQRRLPQRETLDQHVARAALDRAERCETVHGRTTARNPLPQNIASRDDLPADRGWWGYSFRDVPRRASGETVIARLPHCRVISCRSDRHDGDFYPAICTPSGHALDLREIRFRPMHTRALRRAGPARRLERATWVAERVYDNHSHWLTAHLPKLLLLKQRGELDDVLLPRERTPVMDASMRMAGMEPGDFSTFATGELLEIDELTVLQTDRFRSELLRLVPQALGVPAAADPDRRIFISRARAPRRRLVNEDDIWNLLQPAGFERICMEDLTFEQQAQLMGEASVVVAPHGAGLTNMLLCPAGARVVEIADLSFPNPNFYALACALGHQYWIIEAQPVGAGHPLKRNMRVDPRRLQRHLDNILSAAARHGPRGALRSAGAAV